MINKPGDNDYLTADGNITAPFSLYSSSVTTEHNALVVERYAPGVEITNLHNDGYGTIVETPLQGLFTETWVGGHEHRHVDINRGDPLKAGPNNLDSPDDRPEGFRLLLGRPSIGGYAWPSGALGIVDPQYPDPGSPAVRPPYLFDRPKANMTRGLVTKRPVNIRNILSTTSSTRLGNYSKNYQVIQTAGRSINDPFFQDQSFNFALNPETLATRGRTPMARPAGGIGSALFGGSTGFLQMDTDTGATWEALIGGAGSAAKAYSYALWINPSAMGDNYPLSVMPTEHLGSMEPRWRQSFERTMIPARHQESTLQHRYPPARGIMLLLHMPADPIPVAILKYILTAPMILPVKTPEPQMPLRE